MNQYKIYFIIAIFVLIFGVCTCDTIGVKEHMDDGFITLDKIGGTCTNPIMCTNYTDCKACLNTCNNGGKTRLLVGHDKDNNIYKCVTEEPSETDITYYKTDLGGTCKNPFMCEKCDTNTCSNITPCQDTRLALNTHGQCKNTLSDTTIITNDKQTAYKNYYNNHVSELSEPSKRKNNIYNADNLNIYYLKYYLKKLYPTTTNSQLSTTTNSQLPTTTNSQLPTTTNSQLPTTTNSQ